MIPGSGPARLTSTSRSVPTSAGIATSPRWPASITWPTATSRPWSARWRCIGSPREVDTIFIGGGTPTRLDARRLERLVAMVHRWFPLAPGGEWTVEANPGTLDEEKADVLAVGRREPGEPGGAVVPARVAAGAGAEPRPRGGRASAGTGPPAVPTLVVRPDLRRPRLDRRALDGRPGGRPGSWARAPVMLRAGLREGDRALEAVAGRAGPRGRRGVGAGDVRPHDRPARPRRAGDVRDLELRPTRPRVAAQPGLLGQRRLFRRRRWARRDMSGGSARSTRATCPPTSAGSRPASRRPARPRRSTPRPAPARPPC